MQSRPTLQVSKDVRETMICHQTKDSVVGKPSSAFGRWFHLHLLLVEVPVYKERLASIEFPTFMLFSLKI